MVLVHFAVHSSLDLLLLGADYLLMLNGRVDGLVDGSIMLSISGEERTDSCLGLVHFDICEVVMIIGYAEW